MDETNSWIEDRKEPVEEAEVVLAKLPTPRSEGSGMASEDSGFLH